jgi:spermidine synthase
MNAVSLRLLVVAFGSGSVVMAAELSTGRLVAPYYGTSSLVWSLVIGTVLASLAAGHVLGGRLARQGNTHRSLAAALFLSALFLILLPLVSRPVMVGSLSLFQQGAFGTLLAGAAGVSLLLALPLLGLGVVGPLLIHEAVHTVEETGAVAGRLYAVQTAGSLVGTYGAGLALIPWLGTARTLWLCAMVLLLLTALASTSQLRVLCVPVLAALLLALGAGPRAIHPGTGTLYETETPYNYVRVKQTGTRRTLVLNDGYAAQSIYDTRGRLPLESVWGYYALAPAWTRGGSPRDVLLLGLGGGSSARLFDALYPDAHVTGVELDAEVVEAGRRYMGLPEDTHVVISDARAFVRRTPKYYDLIVVDAFDFPYVPFQLTTQEFHQELGRRLRPGGAVVVNVGRNGAEYDVVHAVAHTLGTVFPHVRGVDAGAGSNTLLIATRHPATKDAGVAHLDLPRDVQRTLSTLRPPHPWRIPRGTPLLTDDHAPVEALTDRIVARHVIQGLKQP